MLDEKLIKQVNKRVLEEYLFSFLPSDYIKEECCDKFLIRNSMRFCEECPNHTLRNNDGTPNEKILSRLIKLVEKENYNEFVRELEKLEAPTPINEELEHLANVMY